MLYIVIGCLAFIFIYLFDINKIKRVHKAFNLTFAVGLLMLAFSTVAILLWEQPSFELPLYAKIIFVLLALIALALQLAALFVSLPFKKTYVGLERNQVVDTGMYALSRHPGVICFFFIYLFLWLASGKMLLLWAGIIWTGLDILHVYIQDRWLFPPMLKGYEQYREKAPFLIPTKASIKRCFFPHSGI